MRGLRAARAQRLPVALALLGIAAIGLYLRLRHNGYGLPYVYGYDEARHFTNRAVRMVGGDLDPRYYQNPSAFTYLSYLALRAAAVVAPGHFGGGSVARQWIADRTPILEVTRTLAALLGMAGCAGVFWVGRRVWGTAVGLVAAAILAVAFLPVTYSRTAVTDVGVLLPVAIALYGALRVHERGSARDYLIAGAGAGLAAGFKYTAALALAPLVVAAALRPRGERRAALRGLGLALGAALVLFAATTPYAFVHPVRALYQLKTQAAAAGGAKLGQSRESGFAYYLTSLTWGLGWTALAAAAGGAVLELRRDRRRAALLLALPVVLLAYMGSQSRYFARWILPLYPVLALLAAVAVVWLARRARGTLPRAALVAGLAAALLAQPFAADLRTSHVLGRADTRDLTRDWLVAHFPPGARVVVEPAVPRNWYVAAGALDGRSQLMARDVADDVQPGSSSAYARTRTPGLIDAYRRTGYCLVATMSVVRGRAENARLPRALAYYRQLARESTLVLRASPFKAGRRPLSLDYDFSYDYYPTAYARPGPDVRLYRLRDCREGYGPVPLRPVGAGGLAKGVGTPRPGPGERLERRVRQRRPAPEGRHSVALISRG